MQPNEPVYLFVYTNWPKLVDCASVARIQLIGLSPVHTSCQYEAIIN